MARKTTSDIKRKLVKPYLSVNDLLAQSDVNECLETLTNKRAGMTQLLAVYQTEDGTIHWQASDITYQDVLWMTEVVKQTLFTEDEE